MLGLHGVAVMTPGESLRLLKTLREGSQEKSLENIKVTHYNFK